MSLVAPELMRPWLAQPVAVFGGGVSGAGVCALLAELGAAGVIYDEKTEPFTPNAARKHRLVVFSPGFSLDHPWFTMARTANCTCLAEIDFASLSWRGHLVAITGTNGKTTLTEFLTHALRSSGREAHATGNIGHSFSQLVAEKNGGAPAVLAICEISSFQAEPLKHLRPDALLWTNFAEDHLERHLALEGYFSAKWNLLTRTDPRRAFVGSSVAAFAAKFGRRLPENVAIPTEGQPVDPQLANTVFADYPQRENFLLASAWWRAAELTSEQLYAAARDFKLGRHRLARIGEHLGVGYWNDSKATNFHAVEAALERFPAPVILIAGGRGKGGDVAGFVHRIAGKVRHAILIGETAADLAFQCSTFRVAHTRSATLADAVQRAAELAGPDDNVLLSPGFASFDMFSGYADRGEQFEKLVGDLKNSASFG
jgi:UDP-N-acetylmuramoylalanine--D-glutamate ligase